MPCRIDLGTAVRVRIVARDGSVRRVEGVVIEVVERNRESKMVVSDPVLHDRYLVQCDGWQGLVRARDLQVVAW